MDAVENTPTFDTSIISGIKHDINESNSSESDLIDSYSCSTSDTESCKSEDMPRYKDSIDLKIVSIPRNLRDDSLVFHPHFVYQLFGSGNNLLKYKDLKIYQYYTASSLELMMTHTYSDVITEMGKKTVEEVFRSWIPFPYKTNKKDFLKVLNYDKLFRPLGTFVCEFSLRCNNKLSKYEIYFNHFETFEQRSYHLRFQSLIVYFINGANCIEIDDANWCSFYIYQRKRTRHGVVYYSIGFASCFKFYKYPDKIRPRISQFFILPPYQRQGIGKHFFRKILEYFDAQPDVYEVTVEDPNEKFCALRDQVYTENLLKLRCMSQRNIRQGFTDDMIETVRRVHKMDVTHIRRTYEIIRFYYLSINDRENPTEFKNEMYARIRKDLLEKQAHRRGRCETFYKRKSLVSPISDTRIAEEIEKLKKEYTKIILKIGRNRS